VNQQNAQADPGSSPSVFARQEKKYLLAPGASEKLLFLLGTDLELDGYGPTLISNIYLDTPEHLLVRRSIEKPDFKEKLRIRTYGNVLSDAHPAFLELKKKYLGTVYKRRVKMTLQEALRFVSEGIVPLSPYKGDAAKVALNHQIMDEFQWTLEHYGSLRPSLSVTYERSAYTYTTPSGSLRLTLDSNLAWTSATTHWDPVPVCCCRPLLPPGGTIMEIKTSGALPLGFTRVLSELGLFPQGFSKVGHAYEALIKGEGQQ
jgi:hypothetical protein